MQLANSSFTTDYSYGFNNQSRTQPGTPFSIPATPMSSVDGDGRPMSSWPMRSETPDDASSEKELPYAQLIFKALMQAPGHTMILKDIYAWFLDNTEKAAEKNSKGWQNSIRHNLSMNGVSSGF